MINNFERFKKKSICNIFFLFSAILFAQNNHYKLELKYHENSTYLAQFEKSIRFKTKKKGDKETLKYFDSLGLKKNLKGSKEENYKVKTITNSRIEDQSVMSSFYVFDNSYLGKLNDEKIKKKTKFNTIEIKARIYNDNRINIEKVLVDGKKDEKVNAFKSLIERRNKMLKFPQDSIQIGDLISFLLKSSLYYNEVMEDFMTIEHYYSEVVKTKTEITQN